MKYQVSQAAISLFLAMTSASWVAAQTDTTDDKFIESILQAVNAPPEPESPQIMAAKAEWDTAVARIERINQDCLDMRGGCGSALGMMWDKELNKQYKALITQLDSTSQVSLKAAQRAWISFRDKEADLKRTFFESGYSAMRDVMEADIANITRKRAEDLHDYYMDLLYME